MKVRELIDELSAYDGEVEVHFSYNYGDHWRTTVAPIVSGVDLQRVCYSSYHSMPMVVDEDDKRYEGAMEVVVVVASS